MGLISTRPRPRNQTNARVIKHYPRGYYYRGGEVLNPTFPLDEDTPCILEHQIVDGNGNILSRTYRKA